MKNNIVSKNIYLTIDEITNYCSYYAINILFSFDNKTKLAKTDFLSNINALTIS